MGECVDLFCPPQVHVLEAWSLMWGQWGDGSIFKKWNLREGILRLRDLRRDRDGGTGERRSGELIKAEYVITTYGNA